MSDLDVNALLDGSFRLPTDRPFTFGEARELGVTSRALTGMCRAGIVRRLVKGVYVAATVPDSLGLRCEALRLVVPRGAVVTDRTAGWLHGADMILAPNAHLEVPPVSVFHRSMGGRLRNGICASGQRMMPGRDIEMLHGLLVTTRLRTAHDLGRLLPRDQAFAAMEAMLRLGGFHHEAMIATLLRYKGYRGVRQLRTLALLADHRSESPGESVLRLRWLDCVDLPHPEPQVSVPGPRGTTLWIDMGVRDLRFGAEYDGEEFHGDEQAAHDGARRDWLAKHAGWELVVVRRDQVFGRHQCADVLLRAGLRRALRRRGYSSHEVR